MKARLRQAVYMVLRTGFRLLPLSEGHRDRLRGHFLGRHGDWVPPPPRGRMEASGDGTGRRPLTRADEAAIGHVPYRKEPLPEIMPATLVAFYLPQFHPIVQNDAWWGKGFTEWRNVSRALPQFEGHAQPRLPADLGFYDLRNPQVMREQATLAREYGVGAFCFYFYWFSGTTLLDSPLRQWLADDSIDLPFCLCWANENWARRWDGRDDDILIGQQHSAEDDIAFIGHVADYLRDRRALKVDGKPMLLVYRPHLLPDARATAQRWRKWCREHDIGEIHLAYVQGFERPDPRAIDFDAAVEFPPNMSNPRSLTADQYLINPDFEGDVRDWRSMAVEIGARALPDYTLYPGVNPAWDNEARRSGRGRVYLHASPRGYRDWLSTTIHQRLAEVPKDKRFVFINAWNEWAEGAVLEPDMRLGYAYLQATRQALHGPARARPERPAVVVETTMPKLLSPVLRALESNPHLGRVSVITSTAARPVITSLLSASDPSGKTELVSTDAAPLRAFLQIADDLLRQQTPYVLRLRLDTVAAGAAGALEKLLANLSTTETTAALALFAQEPTLGMSRISSGDAQHTHAAISASARAKARLGITATARTPPGASAPLHYWARLEALRPILDAHLAPSELYASATGTPSSFTMALEALMPDIIAHAGFRASIAPPPAPPHRAPEIARQIRPE